MHSCLPNKGICVCLWTPRLAVAMLELILKQLKHTFEPQLLMSRKKQRSAKQQAQSAGNLAQINGPNKENQPPKTHLVPASALEAVLKHYDHERKRGDDYKRRLNNEHRKHGRAVAQSDKLQADAAASKSKLKEVVGILADTDTKLAKACSELTCI